MAFLDAKALDPEASKKFMSDAAEKLAPYVQVVGVNLKEGAQNLGIQATIVAARALKETVAPAVEKLVQASPQAGSDFGRNFGVGALEKVEAGAAVVACKACTMGSTICKACAALKAAVVSVATVKTLLICTGGVVIVAGGYGCYRAWRYFYPTKEKMAAEAKLQLDIAKSQAATARLQRKAESAAIIAQKEKALKESLLRNQTSARNSFGVPLACQAEAASLAVVAGRKRVEKIVTAFNKYAPQAQRA